MLTDALEGGSGVVVDSTPFHPLDHTWPDQPADTGLLIDGERVLPVVGCLTGAVEHGGGPLYVGEAIPVRRGSAGWHWLAVHVVEEAPPAEGARVTLRVDAERRAALSAGHTGCHLAALALNEALSGRWRKEIGTDALGRPDFDQAAIASSRIRPFGSVDVYRLGKSLRKKGFTTDGLAGELPELAARVTARLAAWTAADAKVWIDVPGPELTARRTWHCALPEGEASIPCGGTHLASTGPLAVASVALALDAAGGELTMTTTVAG
ncbi:hypothetical protein GCM10010468_48110 [Actinocorallia longicatena]|uniref:Alanyl-tRNA synthetase n=1 Tax=Actinocorallia longicatena TaxID=111803 RepID=A0ABP6QDN3_9ACTN